MSFVRGLKTGPAILLLVAIWLILCLPWFWAKRTVPYDSRSQFYPVLYFVSQSLRNKELPFWNPYIYSGYPSISDPQSMMFSPLALAMMVAVDKPSFYWFDTVELIHILMGGIGMLLVCIRFGYMPLAGLFSAAVYMFGGSASARMQHVPMILAYSYFPFALLTLDKALDSNRVRWALCFGAIAGILAAHQNQAAYVFCWVLAGYAVYIVCSSAFIWRFLRSRLRVIVTGLSAGLLTLAIPLYATLQFLPLSNRPRIPFHSAVEFSLHPIMFLTLFVPNFFENVRPVFFWGIGDVTTTFLYAGTLPIVLTIFYGLFSGELLESRFRYFLAVGIAAALYAVGDFTPLYQLLYRLIPGVSLFRRPSDATFVLNMTIALATGFMMNRLLSGRPLERRPFPLFLALSATGGLLVWGLTFAGAAKKWGSTDFLKDVLLAILSMEVAVGLIYAIRKSKSFELRLLWTYISLAFLIADLAVHNAGSRLNADAPGMPRLLDSRTATQDPIVQFLQEARRSDEQGLDRVEVTTAGIFWPNAPMVFGVQTTQGYNPLLYALYNRVMGAQESILRPFTGMTPGYDSIIVNLLGVKYIVSGAFLTKLPPQNVDSQFVLIKDSPIKVWRNPRTLPRVLTATAIYLDPDLDRAIDTGNIPLVDYHSTVVLQHAPSTLSDKPGIPRVPIELTGTGKASARIISYRNNRVSTSVQSERDIILVLNDVFYPYWRVFVDGEERELLQANYLFRGVHVGPGEHTVVFRFEPFSWQAVRSTLREIL